MAGYYGYSMSKKNNELRFIKIGNSLALTRGHKVKAGDGREMFRSASGETYEAYRTVKLDEISFEQKEQFVNNYNRIMTDDYDFQQAKDPNDEMKFRPYTFDEIIESYRSENF